MTLLIAGGLLVRFGALSPMAAAAGAVGVFLAAHSGVIVASFAISRRHAAAEPREPRRRRPSLLRIGIGEWLAYQALFVLIQPFERLWMGDDAVGHRRPAGIPVLLIHGYLCNRGAWWWLRRRLRAAGFAVATVDLEPPLGSIDALADQLHARIEALRAEAGADRVALVGHSMGGLAARAYLRRHGSSRVARLVTLASPHHGTWLARYGPGENARQMEPDGAWIRALPAADPRVPTLTVWSPMDNFVAPQDSSRLGGAREQILPGLSHLAMLFSPVVLDVLTRELASSNLTAVGRPGP
ncbi:MAG: esterase/lipase family protein [Hyphomicrobiales bacterium]